MRKMVKSLKCFKYENICVSLGMVYDEIPELLWSQLLWMPIVLSELLYNKRLPWWAEIPLLACMLIAFGISSRKFLRCLRARKFRKIDSMFVAISLLLCIVGIVTDFLICARTSHSPILGAGRAMPGDIVVVRIEPYIATGKVISVTERFDDKHGAYACYRIDFGKLENGESDILTIPFRFVKRIKDGSSLELDNCRNQTIRGGWR